jgi:hypothetical protein
MQISRQARIGGEACYAAGKRAPRVKFTDIAARRRKLFRQASRRDNHGRRGKRAGFVIILTSSCA